MGEPTHQLPSVEQPLERHLDSWKEIAVYLNRDVTTVQRWEKREGMPVHRHVHQKRGSVYALIEELDDWIESRRLPAVEPETNVQAETLPATPSGRRVWAERKARLWLTAATVLCVCLAAGWLLLRRRATVTAAPRVRSLAVLPLRNLSGDPAQQYLAEGITEALIERLANIHDLRVSPYTSVVRFRSQQIRIPEIARTLGVDAVVEGAVTKAADRIHVSAQLISGATDEHFWSENYTREMRDVLTLESDLAQSIAEQVAVPVTGEEQRRVSAVRSVAPEVYESYLKGRFAFGQGNRAGFEESLRYFQDAAHKDGTFAPSYLGMAEANIGLGTVFAGVAPEATRPKVTRFARTALALDPNLVRAHAVLANVLQQQWHWTEAEAEYRLALQLNPNGAQALSGLALWLVCQGRIDEAVASIERARALDPVGVSGDSVARIFFHAHRYYDAIRESRSAVSVQPGNALNWMGLGFALIADNRPAEAIPVLQKAVTISSGSPAVIGVLIRAYAHAGRRGDAIRLLDELKRRMQTGYIPAAAFVNAYLGLRDNEQAFYWLEQAYREQSNILQFVKVHPYFDPIRGDPRFVELVRRVGIR